MLFRSDIAALKAGKPGDMQSLDPEIQKLSVLYGREAQNFDIRIAKSAPPSLRERFLLATAKVFELTLVTADEHLLKVRDVSVLANR